MPPPATLTSNGDAPGGQSRSDTVAPGIPPVLTCDGVALRRSLAKKFNGGVAASTDSELFKDPAPWKPLAKRWDHRLSVEAKSRKSTVLKGLAKHLATPGMISLGGGLPSSEYFPFEKIAVKVPALGHFSPQETRETGQTVFIGKHDVKEGKSAYDLAIALNYGQSTGSAQLLRWVTEHTEMIHNPPYRDWACTLSAGSTSSLSMVYRMFLERGDCVLSEEYTFATAVETSHPLGCRFVGVPMDDQGMIADALDELLDGWDPAARAGARKPFLLYTVPSGQNPTGATQGAERRRHIYRVAQKHDLIVIEDEPYFFLQMDPYNGSAGEAPAALPLPPKSRDDFVASLIPSLLSMDVDGRVVRLDSFSKVLAPGSRCGWTVGSAQICERLQRHGEVSTQHPAGFSQVILHRLLDEQWGHGGYLDWLAYLRGQYTRRRNVMVRACEDHLPPSVATWTAPTAGMFHWIGLDITKHPDHRKRSVLSLEDEIHRAALEQGVLITPGSYFLAEKGKEPDKVFFRATFAAAEFDTMEEAIRRLGRAIRTAFRMED